MKLGRRFRRKSSNKNNVKGLSKNSTASSTATIITTASDNYLGGGGRSRCKTKSSSSSSSSASTKSVSSASSSLLQVKRMSSGYLASLNDTVVLDCYRCGGMREKECNKDFNSGRISLCSCSVSSNTDDDSFYSALDVSQNTFARSTNNQFVCGTPTSIIQSNSNDCVSPLASPFTGTTNNGGDQLLDDYSYENDEYNNIIVPPPPPMFSSKNPPPRGYTVEQGIKDVEEVINQMRPHIDDYKRKLVRQKHDETEEELEYFFRSQESQIQPKEYISIQNIMNQLTDEEKEVCARADQRFYKIALKYARKKMPLDDAYRAMYEDSIRSEIRNYLICYKGKEAGALEEIRKGLQFRSVFCINEARFAMTENPKHPFSQFAYEGCNRYIGDKPRCTVLNYDAEGRAQMYLCGRFNTWETRADLEGFLGSHGYFMERAIAATQTKTNGQLSSVNVVLDFYQFSPKKHSQPMFMLQALLKLLNQQYPQRIHRVYLIEPPFIARFVYKLIKPIVNAMGLCKEVVFVNGEKERIKYFGKTISNPSFMDTIDVQAYYKSPFDRTYLDVFPINED